jgi:heptosyltransferase-2
MMSKIPGLAVLVDRDGTLNQDCGYVTSPDELVLFPGVPEAIFRLNQLGALVIMITNQSAIGRGMMTVETLQEIHEAFAGLLHPCGARIDGIFFCPHHPQDGCHCRKPNVGLIQQAVEHFSLELSRCFFVGDKRSDLEAAQKIGVPGVLVMTSSYSEHALKIHDLGQLSIAHVANTFVESVSWIEQEIRRNTNEYRS